EISQKNLLFEDQHLERLRKASRYFAFPFDAEDLGHKIEEECQDCEANRDYRLRISLSKSGEIEVNRQVLTPLSTSFCQAQVCLQDHNKSGELLETSIGNLVLKIAGKLYTPPIRLGILPGIYRQHLLETGQVEEKVLTLADLAQAEAIYGCNAVR
ncbi:aminotransferase class IV, partial [Streptococcus pneumoniae]|uniref:aminotransferase class IV n=1 Tax=Streptococcus pneumoniae TaxID=1313 RepID=UPI000B20F9F8